MKSFRLTEVAEQDIFEIWAHIAVHNEQAADDLETDIRNACARVAQKPDIGHFRRDLTKRNVRFFAVRSLFLVVYNSETEPLRILRVLHGSRDVKGELGTLADD